MSTSTSTSQTSTNLNRLGLSISSMVAIRDTLLPISLNHQCRTCQNFKHAELERRRRAKHYNASTALAQLRDLGRQEHSLEEWGIAYSTPCYQHAPGCEIHNCTDPRTCWRKCHILSCIPRVRNYTQFHDRTNKVSNAADQISLNTVVGWPTSTPMTSLTWPP